jgi:DNA-binding MarR family transcriptional regulator
MQVSVEPRPGGVQPDATTLPAGRCQDVGVIADLIRRLSRELRLAGTEAERRAGVHAARLHALRRLAECPGMSVSALATATHTDVSSVSVLVTRLVERGFVSRSRDAHDHRRLSLELTPRGRAVVRRALPAEENPIGRAVSRLTDREVRAVATGLSKLAEGFRPAAKG